MSEGKRYYWFKLKDDFFQSKRIKKLRRLAGGDTFTIIYLKMQLIAMKDDGLLEYTGLEDSFAKELALDLDEDPDNVQVTINYLLSCGLMETSDNTEFFLPYAKENVGSEGAEALRQRNYRASIKAKALPSCDNNVTLSQKRNGEKEIEKDKEIEKSKKEDPFVVFAKDNQELLQTLKDFEEMRKKGKPALTDRAKELICSSLQKFPEDEWIPILNQSIMSGWKTVYPLKQNNSAGRRSVIHDGMNEIPENFDPKNLDKYL